MTGKFTFDPKVAFAKARNVAKEKESQAHALLWDRISQKADGDLVFRRSLTQYPEQTIEYEADKIRTDLGPDVEVDQNVVKLFAERAKAEYSAVLPEVLPERVQELIFGTTEDIRKAFTLSLRLSQVLFYSGLGMVIIAFGVAMWGGKEMIAAIFGIGGAGSVLISSLVMNPMDRIQNAAADLVRLQMAYLAYYKQLYLLGASTDSLSREDAIAYSQEIGRATESLMESVQYIVKTKPAKVRGKKKPKAPNKP